MFRFAEHMSVRTARTLTHKWIYSLINQRLKYLGFSYLFSNWVALISYQPHWASNSIRQDPISLWVKASSILCAHKSSWTTMKQVTFRGNNNLLKLNSNIKSEGKWSYSGWVQVKRLFKINNLECHNVSLLSYEYVGWEKKSDLANTPFKRCLVFI